MNGAEIIPFSENALRRLAQIIEQKYLGIVKVGNLPFLDTGDINDFFGRAGCRDDCFIDDVGDTFLSFTKIQNQRNGRTKIIRIIEQLCDPEEYFEDHEKWVVVIKQINEVLSRYYLKVSKDGKVLTSPILIALDDTVSTLNEYREGLREAREHDSSLKAEKGKYLAREQQRVFVCYSHKDANWLEQLQVHLKPLESRGIIELWDDTKIPAGAIWREEIENAIEAATVAVTLISPDFLASDFISKYELPTLLSHAKTKGTRILSVVLSHCLFDGSGLDIFQTVNIPTKPLKAMTRGERDKIWVKLAKAIQISLGQEKP